MSCATLVQIWWSAILLLSLLIEGPPSPSVLRALMSTSKALTTARLGVEVGDDEGDPRQSSEPCGHGQTDRAKPNVAKPRGAHGDDEPADLRASYKLDGCVDVGLRARHTRVRRQLDRTSPLIRTLEGTSNMRSSRRPALHP